MVSREGEIPLSFAQQRLWFLDQLEPGNPFYNIPFAVRLRGELDIRALEKAFREVIKRHEVLRTSFDEVEGQLTQVIASELEFELPVIDLQHYPEEIRETMRQGGLPWRKDGIQFDLSRIPLIRTKLLMLDEQDYLLLLTMHHIISDGWSTGILAKEIITLYEVYATGKGDPLPELKIQYADFAAWQRQWFQGEVLGRQLEYWRKQLESVSPMLYLPTDRPRPAVEKVTRVRRSRSSYRRRSLNH